MFYILSLTVFILFYFAIYHAERRWLTSRKTVTFDQWIILVPFLLWLLTFGYFAWHLTLTFFLIGAINSSLRGVGFHPCWSPCETSLFDLRYLLILYARLLECDYRALENYLCVSPFLFIFNQKKQLFHNKWFMLYAINNVLHTTLWRF